MKKIRQPYEYIPKYDIDSVKTKTGKVIESEDLLDGAYMIKRKKKVAAPKKVKLKWDDAAEKLMNAESDIWDELDIQSGSQLYGDKELQKKYIAAAAKLDDIFLASNNKEKTLDKLTDENYHRLRQYLGMKFIAKEREDYEKMYKEYPNTMLVPDYIKQEFKAGGTLLSFRTKSLSEKAADLVGSTTWNELNSQEKEEVISELISDGVLTASFAFGGDVSAPVSTKISEEEISRFVDYIEGYYGKDGIFKEGDGFTRDEIKNAIQKYFNDLYATETWGHGDTVDRERVKMYLLTPELKEDDMIWNEMGKKFIVDKVTDEYYLMSGFKNAKLKIRKEVVHEGLKKGEFTLYPKFARGGNVGNPYSFDITAKRSNGETIKQTRVAYGDNKKLATENLIRFLEDKLGYTNIKIQSVRSGHEGISKLNYAKGGGVETENKPIKYGDLVVGKDYFQVTRPELGIEKITITEKDRGTYKYKYYSYGEIREQYVTKYNGKYTDGEELYGIYEDKNDAKAKAINLLTEKMSKYAKGGGVAEAKYLVTFEINGTKKEKSFDSKEKADSFVELMSDEEDIKGLKIEEKPKEETSLFSLAKAAPPKKSSKREKESVEVNGIASDISRYDELKEIIDNAEAEKELIGGALKQIGKQKFLEIYQQRGVKPDNFNLSDADEKIMFIVMDAYKKVEPEKAAILQNYDGLLETITTYSLNPEVLERIGETVSKIIMESKLISDEDKRNLLKIETTVGIKKGSIERLMQYEDPAVVFDLIEPKLALK